MLWELRTYAFYEGKREQYLALWEHEILPLYDEIGLRVVGCWTPNDDPNQYVWLRVYDDAAERDAKTKALRERPEWPGIWQRIQECESGTATRDLWPTDFSPADAAVQARNGSGDLPFGLFELRQFKLAAGRRDEYLALYRESFGPICIESGMTVVGAWLPADDPDGFLILRAYRDAAEREQIADRIRANPKMRVTAGKFAGLDQGRTWRDLTPTGFSPMGRYLRVP